MNDNLNNFNDIKTFTAIIEKYINTNLYIVYYQP